jgi:GNAT superfamily N-acetyltransferase
MWVRRATTDDVPSILSIDDIAQTSADRRSQIASGVDRRTCWLAGRSQSVEGYVVCLREFFGRDFVSVLLVAEAARRNGIGSALMAAVEQAHTGRMLFTSTNQSNIAMQRLLAGRGYAAAGTILYLDPGDPELVFVKDLS